MRRIVLWSMSTLTVLILLFGYHTSTSSRMTTTADSAAIAPISGGSPAAGPAGTAATAAGPAGGGITTPSAPAPAPASGTGTGTGSAPASGSGSADAAPPTTAAGAATTVTGSVAQTRWGPVQVQLTVAGGRITDVSVIQYPHENGKDQQINARALPVLIDETISAQSASIDMVSGATVTSEGYLQSLQSALDRAGL